MERSSALYGLVQRQMQLRARDQDVVLSVRIVRIDAERVLVADVPGIDGAEHAVVAGKAIAPVPLLAHDLEHRRVLRERRRTSPRRTRPGASIAATPTDGEDR